MLKLRGEGVNFDPGCANIFEQGGTIESVNDWHIGGVFFVAWIAVTIITEVRKY